jgi:hypothetical protein
MADINSIKEPGDYLVRDNRAAGHGDHYAERPFDLLAIIEIERDGDTLVRLHTRRVTNVIFDDRGVPHLPPGMGASFGIRRSLERATAAEKRYASLPASELRCLPVEATPEPVVLEPTPAADPEPVTIERLYALMATLLDEQRTTNALLRQIARPPVSTGQQEQLSLLPTTSPANQGLLGANGAATGAR